MHKEPVFSEKLNAHFLAGSPGLYIQSGEEARVDQLLGELAATHHLHSMEWNLGYGWVKFDTKQPIKETHEQTDLAQCLPTLLDDELDGKLIIIKNARLALDNNSLATARLKQLLNRIQRHHKSRAAVVLVSENLPIPAEIETQISLLPLPLPLRQEIGEQIDKFCTTHTQLLMPDASMRNRACVACSGLSQMEIDRVLTMVTQHTSRLDDKALALIQSEKEQVITKGGVLEMVKVSEKVEDIGGLENLKKWLSTRATIIKDLPKAESFGVTAPKGVLITGMPGCGKSLTAKVAASLFELPLLRLDIGSLLGKYVGESEHNMRRALSMAETLSPCVLWVDELEKAFVGMGGNNASEVTSRLLGYFLTWMQEKTGAVFVIATANDITALPPELLRKGRFDEIFYVGFPNAVERQDILSIHLRKAQQRIDAFDMDALMRLSRDFSGADIQNAINEALAMAFVEGHTLTQDHLAASLRTTIPMRMTLLDSVGRYEEAFEKNKLKSASKVHGLGIAEMRAGAKATNPVKRMEVAAHADCPDDLLEQLSQDEAFEVKEAVYNNTHCPESVLSACLSLSDNDSSAHDKELYALALRHPNAPTDLLVHLIELGRLTDDACLHLAKQSHCSSHVLVALLSRSHSSLDQAVLRHANCPVDIITARLNDKKEHVREALAGNPTLSEAQQMALINDNSICVRRALARNPQLVKAVRVLLNEDAEASVRSALQMPEVVDETVTGSLAARSLSETDALEIITKGDVAARTELAKNPGLSHALQIRLLDDEDDAVKAALAANPMLRHEAQERLAAEGAPVVRLALAGNPALIEAQQSYLATTGSEEVKRGLAENPSLIERLQNLFVMDEDWAVRRALAGNVSITPKHQAELFKDKDIDVRTSLAGNPALADELQALLMGDTDEKMRVALAKNPSLSVARQLHLAKDSNSVVRENLAENPSLSEAAQAILAGDYDSTKEKLARNPSLAVAQQAQLASCCVEVRLALLDNPSLSKSIKNKVCKSFDKDDLNSAESDLKSASENYNRIFLELMSAGKKYGDAVFGSSLFNSERKREQLRREMDRLDDRQSIALNKMMAYEKKVKQLKECLNEYLA